MGDALTGPVNGPDGNGSNNGNKPEKAGGKADKSLYRILNCGDFGGMARRKVVVYDDPETGEKVQADTEDGEYETYEAVVEIPCQNPSSFGLPGAQYGITPGRCYKHTPAGLDRVARKKAVFLDAYIQAPELGIGPAAERAGMASRSDIYWWKEHDPEFRENMEAIMSIAEAVLTDRVEEDVIAAIREWRPGAARLAEWWLVNRRGHKWKALGKTSDDGGVNPKFQGGQHVHVWRRGNEFDQFPGG